MLQLLRNVQLEKSMGWTQDPPVLSTLGVQLPLPGTNFKPARDAGVKHIGTSRSSLTESSLKVSCDAAVTGRGRTRKHSGGMNHQSRFVSAAGLDQTSSTKTTYCAAKPNSASQLACDST